MWGSRGALGFYEGSGLDVRIATCMERQSGREGIKRSPSILGMFPFVGHMSQGCFPVGKHEISPSKQG